MAADALPRAALMVPAGLQVSKIADSMYRLWEEFLRFSGPAC
jgi:hypothetical protein